MEEVLKRIKESLQKILKTAGRVNIFRETGGYFVRFLGRFKAKYHYIVYKIIPNGVSR